MPKLNDDRLNKILAGAAGQGPLPWSHYRDAYCGYRRKSQRFTEMMTAYAQKWPNRIIVTRPYDVTNESPMIEVTVDG